MRLVRRVPYIAGVTRAWSLGWVKSFMVLWPVAVRSTRAPCPLSRSWRQSRMISRSRFWKRGGDVQIP